MLVALGAAIVVLLPHLNGMSSADLSRIIQGTLTGIGFIGGGVILKMSDQHQIVGITTAASIWLTATVGIVAGTGRLALAVVGRFWPSSSSRSSVVSNTSWRRSNGSRSPDFYEGQPVVARLFLHQALLNQAIQQPPGIRVGTAAWGRIPLYCGAWPPLLKKPAAAGIA